MKKGFIKLTSLCIVLSVFLAMFTVFPSANTDSGADEGVKVIYNRGYEDGWDYSNGFGIESKYELDVNLTYLKMSATWYNYFLRFAPTGDAGGYLNLKLGEDTPTEGKLFFEFDLKVSAENNIGGIVMFAGVGEGTEKMLSHIVTLKEGSIYLLGNNMGEAPSDWTTVSFVFDFDYAKNNADAEDNSFLITAKIDDNSYERVYTAKAGLGIQSLYFGAQENFYGSDREGDEYFLDNVKVYYGVDEATELPSKTYGSAVDADEPANITIHGAGGASGNYLSGQPTFEREPYGKEQVTVHYNRYFSEGWNYDNGTSSNQERLNDFSIVTDYASEVNKGDSGFLNYYLQMIQRNAQNGFIRIDARTAVPRTGKTYLEFDLKASVGATFGTFVEVIVPGTPLLSFPFIRIVDGSLIVLDKTVGSIGEEWCHIALEMDFDYLSVDDPDTAENEATDPTAIKYTCYVGSDPEPVVSVKHVTGAGAAFKGLTNLRIGRSGSMAAEDEGDWWGIDNLQLYTSEIGFTDIPDDNLGSMVNKSWTKDFAVNSGFSEASVGEIVDDSLTMKVNSNYALLFGSKVNLFTDDDGNAYGGPYKNENGKVMVPLSSVLDYTATPYQYNSGGLACDIFVNGEYRSLAVGRSTVEVNGEVITLSATPELKTFGDKTTVYVGLDDIELLFNGFYVTYDESGMIFIAKYDDFVNRVQNADFIKDTAYRFLYDTDITPEEFYELAKENTNNFEHPFIYADQDHFDYLRESYYMDPNDPDFDEELIWYIDTQIQYADKYVAKYANLDSSGNFVSIKEGQWTPNSQGMVTWDTSKPTGNHSVAIMPYPETGGYDPAGGRLNVLSDGESALVGAFEPVALAYQITHDEKYLVFAYEWMYLLCQWEHWGPGHFLNCANTSRPMAVAYDWLYNAWLEYYGQEALDYIADKLYNNAIYEASVTLKGLPPEHVRPQGDSSRYWNHIGNWNICGTLAMTVVGLTIMEHEEYVDLTSWVITQSLHYFTLNGLTYIDLDGGYREAAGYWGVVRWDHQLIDLLRDTIGTDLGISGCPGIDITDYFGCHTESPDFLRWNFHDDWEGNQPSYWYYLSAALYDNPEYAAIRYTQIHTGSSSKAPNRYDVIYYNKDLIGFTDVDLSLDYVMTGIAASISRSSWEPGSLYTGIMGGANQVAHGQYDAGNWIYDNGGVRWFMDLGADDYNLYGGGLSQGYYKYSAEGNNTLAITSQPETMPHGQMYSGAFGEITSSIVNEHGAATVIDMSSVYGGVGIVSYARRGMLVTNDRKTVVIQDEISCVQAQNFQWFAHYSILRVPEVELSENGRTAIMKSKDGQTLRVSLLTGNRGFKFEIQKCDDPDLFALEATPKPGYSLAMKGVDEGSRENYRRLTIKIENAVKFDLAVAIELIDPENPVEVGYKTGWNGNPSSLPPMETWVPAPDTREGVDDSLIEDDSVELRGRPSMSTILYNAPALEDYITSGTFITTDRDTFFTLLSDIEYTINYYTREMLMNDPKMVDCLAQYDSAKEKYDKYQNKANTATGGMNSIVGGLVGMKKPAAEETPTE